MAIGDLNRKRSSECHKHLSYTESGKGRGFHSPKRLKDFLLYSQVSRDGFKFYSLGIEWKRQIYIPVSFTNELNQEV